MASITYTWISSLLFLLLGYLIHTYKNKSRNKCKPLPPGPKGLPILGNLLMLGKLPHRDLHQLSNRYGPIMYIRLGLVPTVVISSPQAAELFLKTHDHIFASRPFSEVAKYITYDQKGFFTEYGPYWRNIRKLCTLKLLTNSKIESFKSMRSLELGFLIKSLKDAADAHEIVNISSRVSALNANMSCLMVLGRKYIDNGHDQKVLLHNIVQEGMRLGGTPNISDFIPYIGLLDIQGLAKQMKAVSKVYDDILEEIIDEHVVAFEKDNPKDFVDVMLAFMESKDTEFLIDRANIKAIILDMLIGATDTSATAIEWALSELFKNPRVMKKVQDELERAVGKDRMVDESDLPKLEYLEMVFKESLRLHPVAPLLLPHESLEDCMVNGCFIPKKSRIIINSWAIGRNRNAWTDPEKFIPERFLENNVDLRGHHFQLLPFGSGRRSCPGMQLGLLVMRFVVAQLVHCFDWELPNDMLPDDLDMSEELGLTMPRAKNLLAIPKYRLHK